MTEPKPLNWALPLGLMTFILICTGACSRAGEPIPSETPATNPSASSPLPATASPSPSPSRTSAPKQTATPPLSPSQTPLPIGKFAQLLELHMVDEQVGWAILSENDGAFDHLLRTTDGGHTWRDRTPPETAPAGGEPPKVAYGSFLDGTSAWVIYHYDGQPFRVSPVWRTGDGGLTWEASQPLDTSLPALEGQAPIFGVHHLEFVDRQHGWLMLQLDAAMGHSYAFLYSTVDGGANWTRIVEPPGTPENGDLHYCCKTGMDFTAPHIGLISFGVGPKYTVFVNWTRDGGHSWVAQELPPPVSNPDLFSSGEAFCGTHSPTLLAAETARLGVECRLDSGATMSFLYRTEDGGQTWQAAPAPNGALLFLSPQVGWALSEEVHRTQNGGQDWEPLSKVRWQGEFCFVSDKIGWAIAQHEEDVGLVRTRDGGRTWELLTSVILP